MVIKFLCTSRTDICSLSTRPACQSEQDHFRGVARGATPLQGPSTTGPLHFLCQGQAVRVQNWSNHLHYNLSMVFTFPWDDWSLLSFFLNLTPTLRPSITTVGSLCDPLRLTVTVPPLDLGVSDYP